MTLFKRFIIKSPHIVAIALSLLVVTPVSHAENAAAIDEMAGYLDFIDYGVGSALEAHERSLGQCLR